VPTQAAAPNHAADFGDRRDGVGPMTEVFRVEQRWRRAARTYDQSSSTVRPGLSEWPMVASCPLFATKICGLFVALPLGRGAELRHFLLQELAGMIACCF